MIIYIIIIGIIIISLILIFIISVYNKFQVAILKISQVENKIDDVLHNKKEILIRLKSLINKSIKKNVFIGIDCIKEEDINNFEFDKELNKYNRELNDLLDENNKLNNNNNIIDLERELNDINDTIMAIHNYYNDNVIIYNKLIKSFPSGIVSKMFRYRKKDFYSNEKEEIYEILKNKNQELK